MDINNAITFAEKAIRDSDHNCCDSKQKLEVIISCSTTDKECNIVAMCPSCRTKFSIESENILKLQTNEKVVCDIKRRRCDVVTEVLEVPIQLPKAS